MIRRAAVHGRRIVVGVWHCPNTFACWLRVSYPHWAPRHSHMALVALCGQEGSLLEQRPRSAT